MRRMMNRAIGLSVVFAACSLGTLKGQNADENPDSLVVSAEAFEAVPAIGDNGTANNGTANDDAANEKTAGDTPESDATKDKAAVELVAAEFDVAFIMTQVQQETGWSRAEMNSWLISNVNSLLHASTDNTVLEAQKVQRPDGSEELMVVSENGAGSLLEDNKLLVRATAQRVTEVRDFLKRIQETGVRQVLVRVNVFTGPAEAVKNLPVAWSHVATASNIGAAAGQVQTAGGSAFEPTSIAAGEQKSRLQALYDRSNGVFRASFERQQEQANASKLLPPPGAEGSTWVNASSIVERATPVLYTLLAPTELEKVLSAAEEAEAISGERGPSVGVYDGNTATIKNIVERPLVVGIEAKAAGEADNRRVMFLPRTRVYPHGDSLTLRPQIIGGHQVRLACNAEDFSIRKIDTLDFPTADGSTTLRVQLPEVGYTRFQTQIDIPLGFALAIYTADNIEGKATGKLRILTCAVKDVEQNER